jgi:hypothetical protein
MQICTHLEPILSNELNCGNSIKEINENAWTNALLVINMNNPINQFFANEEIKKYDGVMSFENTDNHYELQSGYFCKTCKHAITGPKIKDSK